MDRAAAVGVLADRVLGLAEAGGRGGVGAVLGVAEHRAPRSRAAGPARSAGPEARRRPAAGRGRFRGRSAPASAASDAPFWVVTVVSSSPATTWALVTTSPGAPTQPEPSTPSPQAVPSTRTTEAPARDHVRVADDLRIGRADRGGRADDRGRRVDPVERVQDRARGRQHVVEAAQDQRALHVGPQLRGPRRVQRDGAEDPDEAQRHRGDQRGAAGAVGQVQHAAVPDQSRAQPQRQALQGHRHQRPRHQRAERRAQRRIGRLRPLVQHQRPDPAPGERPHREPDQRQRRRRSAPAGIPTSPGPR